MGEKMNTEDLYLKELPIEQSYIENILRLNKGRKAKIYMSFSKDNHKVFTGTVRAAGRDHILLEDEKGTYLLLMIYLDYIEFDEKITYKV